METGREANFSAISLEKMKFTYMSSPNSLKMSYSSQTDVSSKSHLLRDNFSYFLTSWKLYLPIFFYLIEYFQVHSLIFDSQHHWDMLKMRVSHWGSERFVAGLLWGRILGVLLDICLGWWPAVGVPVSFDREVWKKMASSCCWSQVFWIIFLAFIMNPGLAYFCLSFPTN